jgi:hypothetical protein
VLSKRFAKKQQERWTLAGAHLLLQIRVKVLNGDWRATLPELVRRLKRTRRGEGGLAPGFTGPAARRPEHTTIGR